MVFMLFMLAANTVMRYTANFTWKFAEEYTGYGLVFMTFVPLAYTLKHGGHISIDVLVDRLSEVGASRVRIVTTIISIVVTAILLRYGAELMVTNLLQGSRSNTVMLTPLWIPQTFIVVGLALFIPEMVVYLLDQVREVRQKRSNTS